MTEKKNLEKQEEFQETTDNPTVNMTNEQLDEENQITKTDSADNSADELAQLKDSHIRLMAEYDNYRKRTIKEKAELIRNGGERVLIGLLPVIDDFERALKNITPEGDSENIAEGVYLIYNKFMTFLKQNGVQPINALGEFFDDELFDAIATIPTQDEDSKGKVIDCVLTGYKLNDKVIRHSKVVVAG
ncbi:MAG: nucleotide exchange factor GrpE [Dysgonamonadaceae bacterium]|jgi:molecular chaperone GrpE|nr:nucleotide exchange factor GrpE [Dysgonamonadaceae bacterium]